MRFILAVVLVMSGFINSLIAQSQSGIASVRPLAHEGIYTEAGAIFSHDSLVASHRSIPFGSIVKITNLKNQKSVDVMINDRGPFINGRIVDLSEYAGQQIGLSHGSLANVRLDVLKIAKNYSFKNYSSTNTTGEYTVQVGSFSEKTNAVDFASKLSSKYQIKDVIVKADSIQNKPVFKVYVGKFRNRDVAEQYLSQLPAELKDGFVTTLPK
jgi:rare lipoprotein A